MREVCKSGAVVAAVVAVLEKQSEQIINSTSSSSSSSSSSVTKKRENSPSSFNRNNYNKTDQTTIESTTKNIINTNKSVFINRNTQESRSDEKNNFELAVQDFNTVAEDVEKTFFVDSKLVNSSDVNHRFVNNNSEVKRKNCLTIDLKSEEFCSDREKKHVIESASNSSCSEELLLVLGYKNNEHDIDSDSLERSTDSEGELFLNEGGLATITEEERISGSSARSSRGCDDEDEDEDDSSIADDTTLKDRNQDWSGSASNHDGSTSDLSSTSSGRNNGNLESGSTRCNRDFQWIRKEVKKTTFSPPRTSPQFCLNSPRMDEELILPSPLNKPPISRPLREKAQRRSSDRSGGGPSAPGSLDRRRSNNNGVKREERDQKSRSSHIKSPPRLEDFHPNLINAQYPNGYCCPPNYEGYFENFHRRHERSDPQRYGSSPMLMEHRESRFSERGSHSDIYNDCSSRHRHEMSCCSYHLAPPPPCCYFGGERGFHWTPPSPYSNKPGEHEEKIRKMQYERDNLQLQVQVLTEQVEAQSNKITDLEKILLDKKNLLSDAEEKLQMEVLSRSSLETQKLELMSIMSELKLTAAALERENLELRGSYINNNSEGGNKKPPLGARTISVSQNVLTSTPQYSSQGLRSSPTPSPINSKNSETYQNDSFRPKTPPSNYKRQIDVQYGSLPRQQFISNGTVFSLVDNNANPQKKGVVFGNRNISNSSLQHLQSVVGCGRLRGFSVPNLAENDKILEDSSESKENSPASPTLTINKNKGIKKYFGKMRRSGSGNLEDLPAGINNEFQRGGVRATASARLGWSEPQLSPKPDKPFAEWDTENICDWLQDLSLDQYIADAKRWIKNGQQLLECSITEIEKELNIKNPLHRKKIQLALIDSSENASSDPYLSKAGKLDTAWVLRWLDDAGLPQYKENFLINRIDGRVLHRLTIDDLALLHVTSLLHVASIKRGIQVLRENNYDPSCLQRRSLPDDPEQPTIKQISLWTTHRAMEWLRAVDLAEYAPNLRGAGVHGGLMVLEPKFNADLLASLLAIPPGKTLLRRHLNTHFKELLGKDIIQEKRELETTLGYTPLTPSSKLKIAKKSQFSLKRKKSKGEADYGDLVCPLNPDQQSGELSNSALNMGMMMKKGNLKVEDVYHHVENSSVTISKSVPTSVQNSPIVQRHV